MIPRLSNRIITLVSFAIKPPALYDVKVDSLIRFSDGAGDAILLTGESLRRRSDWFMPRGI